jgi:hypothetical protein
MRARPTTVHLLLRLQLQQLLLAAAETGGSGGAIIQSTASVKAVDRGAALLPASGVPCIARDWSSLCSCVAALSSGNRVIELTCVIDVLPAGVAISTSGATLYSTTGGGLRRKNADLSHGSILEVHDCSNVTLLGLAFIDTVSAPGKFEFCSPPNSTGGAQLSLASVRFTTVTGCTFLNASVFNVAISSANFTLFSKNTLRGCCLFGLWSPFHATQTNLLMMNNDIRKVNSNAFLFTVVDSLIQGNTIAQTHTATVFGHDSGGQCALNNGSARVVISGNLIVNGSVTAGDVGQKTHGFEFSNGPSGVSDVLVQGNLMFNNTGFGLVADGAHGVGISGVQVIDNRLCAASTPCPWCQPIGPPGGWVSAKVGNCCDCDSKIRPHGFIHVVAPVCLSGPCAVDITWTTSGLGSLVRVCVEAPWTIPPFPIDSVGVPRLKFGRCWNSSLTGASGNGTISVARNTFVELWAEELAWPLDVAQVVVGRVKTDDHDHASDSEVVPPGAAFLAGYEAGLLAGYENGMVIFK